MTIQFNADNNLTIHEEFRNKLTGQIADKLKRFSDQITRLEVHMSDDNGSKQGMNDKKCLLEARVQGQNPVVVTAHGETYELALDASLNKLRTLLDKLYAKLSNH